MLPNVVKTASNSVVDLLSAGDGCREVVDALANIAAIGCGGAFGFRHRLPPEIQATDVDVLGGTGALAWRQKISICGGLARLRLSDGKSHSHRCACA